MLRIKLEGVVLHTNIEFCEELIARAFPQDICYDWQRILLALGLFVQLTKIADLMNSSILFWDDNVGDAHSLSF